MEEVRTVAVAALVGALVGVTVAAFTVSVLGRQGVPCVDCLERAAAGAPEARDDGV